MREIKFRVWIDEKRIESSKEWRMIYFTLDDIEENGWISYIEFNYNCGSSGNIKLSDKKCNIMQYTGLKDKNGKEIYEGDIIQLNNIKGFVSFSYGCFGVENQKDEWLIYAKDWFVDKNDSIEIIGNIYENPELIE